MMTTLLNRLRPAALLTALVLLLPVPAAAARQYTDVELALISRLTTRMLEKNHYRRQKITRELGNQLFEAYFDALDPSRSFFTVQDVESFGSERDLIQLQLQSGDNHFAFAVYRKYMQRYNEFYAFAEARLKRPFDFTIDEDYVPDRTKLPRPADDVALRKLWEQRLKNDVLYYRLLDRAMRQEAVSGNADAKKNIEADRRWSQRTAEEKVLRRMRDIRNEINQKEPVDILGIYLDTLAQIYGPHSNYLAPKHDEDFEINMSLSLTGIGATLSSDDGMIKVVALVPGGPAAVDGRLKVEDRIIAVTQENGDTTDLIDMPVSRAVQFIRGAKDTRVTLTIIPGEKGRNAAPEQITLVRKAIDLVESCAKGEVRDVTLSGQKVKVGVITLKSFYADFDGVINGRKDAKRCSTDIRKILDGFKKRKVEAVLLDLRRNGGGSLYEALTLSGMFIPTGPVVQLRTSDRRIDVRSDDDPEQVYAGPLVVLTSKFSASSSEILTAALRDMSRAVVVGDSRTFGKGTVLTVERFELPRKFFSDGMPTGSVTYESAMFYRSRGDSVQQMGIEPDVLLPSISEEMEVGEMFLKYHLPWDSIKPAKRTPCDPQLEQKIATLKKHSAKRIALDPEYAKLLGQIAVFKACRDRKKVSLNEEKRWAEYAKEKQMTETSEKMLDEDDPKSKGKDSDFDPVLHEAERISAELALLGKK